MTELKPSIPYCLFPFLAQQTPLRAPGNLGAFLEHSFPSYIPDQGLFWRLYVFIKEKNEKKS
jgi:hypothetical protein